MKKRGLTPGRMIVLGFMTVIIIGAVLLSLPISLEEGKSISILEAIFTSTSAVCVTGLIVVDTGDTFSVFGQTIVALLIQIGGLGITSIGVMLILFGGGNLGFKHKALVKTAFNLNTGKSIMSLIRAIVIATLTFEIIGVVLCFFTFRGQFEPLQALGYSAFHTIASFNNAGFDIFGGFQSMAAYKSDVFINLVTAGLIIFGGIGFFVIYDIYSKKSIRNLTLHSKVVLSTTLVLLVGGTLLIKLSSNATWLESFFMSTSARTAGFATVNLGLVGNSTLLVIMILMFIGASPGSTGGGIKTTTIFTIFLEMRSAAKNIQSHAFKRKVPESVIGKAFLLTTLGINSVCISAFLITLLEPNMAFVDILFEVISAFGTVGLTTGITPQLSELSQVIIIITMFFGRLGPLTMITIWTARHKPSAHYTEEIITIG